MANNKKRRKKLTEQEIEQRQQKREIQTLLTNMGFNKAPGIAGKEFVFEDRTSEIDDVFCFENVILLIEYTITKDIGDHLLKKKVAYDKINNSSGDFIRFLVNQPKFAGFKDYFDQAIGTKYSFNQLRVVILYCSKYSVETEHKHQVAKVCFFEYPVVKYFEHIAHVIKKSALYEFLDFLEIKYSDVGDQILQSAKGTKERFSGHILPEEHSNFKEGYKIVSFYIDAESLLHRAYVLRRDGWKRSGLYQRMLVPTKINSMRRYLGGNERVFVNNIIAVLPINNIKLYGADKNQIKVDENGKFSGGTGGTRVQLTDIEIDDETNIIGIIDGQHRPYAYYEGNDKYESKIKTLRKIQNLLVTGFLYPKNESEIDRLKFEANLFLEINDNQTSAPPQLKQEIELLIRPFSSTAIAKSILNKLNESGPLEHLFEEHFYEKGLKTASIISYGLKPLVKLEGKDSLYKNWQETRKSELKEGKDSTLLNAYEDYWRD